jgi:Di-sulfide bridge nucleocytoplasmic transport domain
MNAKQFGNIAPVTNGNTGSFLFSSTPVNFNRNKLAADFFTPRNTSPGIASSDIEASSAGESPLPDDSPDQPPRRVAPTQYEKIRGVRKYQDAVRRKRIQKPKRAYITGSSRQYDSDSDDTSPQKTQTDVFALTSTNTNSQKPTWTSDPDLPYVASGYVQLVFNMFLVGVALYIGLAFIRTIQRDVDQKVEEYSAGIGLSLLHIDIRNTSGDDSLFKGVSRKSLCTKYTRSSDGKSMSGMGEMHEQGSHSRGQSPSLCRNIC